MVSGLGRVWMHTQPLFIITINNLLPIIYLISTLEMEWMRIECMHTVTNYKKEPAETEA